MTTGDRGAGRLPPRSRPRPGPLRPRGNLVFRWEYLPGSTLFLVWTQDQNSTSSAGDFDFSRDLGDLFDAGADHVFLIKATYWLGI